MIAANELRRGNWFIDYETEPEKTIYYQVEEICKHNKEGKSIGVRFRQGSCWTNIDLIQPILLTEEILLKCGFRKLDKYTFVLNGYFIHKRKVGFVYNRGRYKVILNSLHELQNNYYFNNNKQEIEINL